MLNDILTKLHTTHVFAEAVGRYNKVLINMFQRRHVQSIKINGLLAQCRN